MSLWKRRTRPTHRQTSCRKGCRRQTSREGGEDSGWLYLPASSMSQEWPGEPWSLAAGSPALLPANEAPCSSADYRSLLAHSAFSMRCLQETPPGNLYLQGWQTAISSITGWLRETEPIKWILESTGVFTSVLANEEKKNHCSVEWVARFQEKRTCYAEHMLLPKMPEHTGAGEAEIMKGEEAPGNTECPASGAGLNGVQPSSLTSLDDRATCQCDMFKFPCCCWGWARSHR